MELEWIILAGVTIAAWLRAFSWAAGRDKRKLLTRMDHWPVCAAAHGLVAVEADELRPRLEGFVGDVPVVVDVYKEDIGSSRVDCTRVQATLALHMEGAMQIRRRTVGDGRLGRGLLSSRWFKPYGEVVQIGHELLDRKLLIRSTDPPRVWALLRDERPRELLVQILGDCWQITLEGRELTVNVARILGADLAGFVDPVLALVELFGTEPAEWADAARRWRLEHEPLKPGRGPRLRGTIEGITVEAWQRAPDDDTTVVAQVPKLPRFLSIRAREGAEGGGMDLSDLILDGTVFVESYGGSFSQGVVRRLLCQDSVRGALLTVIQGWPGSTVEDRVVRLRGPGRMVDRLDAGIRDVVELARCLRDSAQADLRRAIPEA